MYSMNKAKKAYFLYCINFSSELNDHVAFSVHCSLYLGLNLWIRAVVGKTPEIF